MPRGGRDSFLTSVIDENESRPLFAYSLGASTVSRDGAPAMTVFNRTLAIVLLVLSVSIVPSAQTPAPATLRTPGLSQPVEILRDRWGIAHIYAQSEGDLFFAQGYSAARDRLFQFELW